MAALMEMFEKIFGRLGFADVSVIFEEIKEAIKKIFAPKEEA